MHDGPNLLITQRSSKIGLFLKLPNLELGLKHVQQQVGEREAWLSRFPNSRRSPRRIRRKKRLRTGTTGFRKATGSE